MAYKETLCIWDFRDFLANNDIYRKVAMKEQLDYPTLVSQMPSNAIKNFAFSNKDGLTFSNLTDQLGFSQASFSNGSAYGDLDNDGDMDLVVNNVNMAAFIYKNEAEKVGNSSLVVKFEGPENNPFGIGAQVNITTATGFQTMQNFNTRGFQSSVEPQLIFGLSENNTVEKVEVIWPDLKTQVLTNIASGQPLTLTYSDATGKAEPQVKSGSNPLFAEVSNQLLKGNAKHQENVYNDFDHEILLWSMLSTEGPRMLTGDVNGDKREDVIFLGASDDEDKLFIQAADGSFNRKAQSAFRLTKALESSCGALFDHDKDGDLDLMLGAGGNEYQKGGANFILRYFENDGKGNFRVDDSKIPQLVGNFSALEPADFDQDGDMDLFLGARCVPGNYGRPPRSFLLINEQGQWQDATPEFLAGIGMVTDAIWADIDQDQDPDLIVVGDWMPVQFFRNDGGNLQPMPPVANSHGWWKRIEAADLDGDGDLDFVAGNWGLNAKLQASPSRPLTMYVNDFDQNGKTEFILNRYAPLDDKAYPFATKNELTQQLPHLRKQILKYENYANQTYESLFPPEVRQNSIPYKADFLASAILWNDNGILNMQALPMKAQLSPVFGIALDDFNGDGNLDIWLGGNFYALKPQLGRHDASHGLLLAGKGGRVFEAVSHLESGIFVEGEVRDAALISTEEKKLLIISRNNDKPMIFANRKSKAQ